MPQYEPVYIKRYKNLPLDLKEAIRGIGIKFSDLKKIYRVYWGGYILIPKDKSLLSFEIRDLLKNGFIRIEYCIKDIILIWRKDESDNHF